MRNPIKHEKPDLLWPKYDPQSVKLANFTVLNPYTLLIVVV